MKQRCYFHKHQFIQNFCVLKQCTLPLCQECLPIHEEQHRTKNQSPKIISYEKAYNQAYQNLTQFIKTNKQKREYYLKKISHDKKQSFKILDKYFAQMQSKIKQQSMELEQIEQKFQKLIKGSIKTLIYYYSGDILLKELNFPSDYASISNKLTHFIENLDVSKKEEIQTFRQINDKQFDSIQIQIRENTQQQQNKNRSRKKSIFSHDKKSSTYSHKNTNEPYLQTNRPQQIRRKLYPANQLDNIIQFNNQDHSNKNEKYSHKTQIFPLYEKYDYKNVEKSIDKYPSTCIGNKQKPMTTVQGHSYQIYENKQTKIFSNEKHQYKSKTLQKYPSSNEFNMKGRRQPVVTFSDQLKHGFSKDFQNKPKKWNKNNEQNQEAFRATSNQNNKFQNDCFRNNISFLNNKNDLNNRKPLKTSDLETYSPTNNHYDLNKFQQRDRAVSHELGMRTMSHNNLPSNRKLDNLDENLKKQVMSPLQIRKMLEKRIQERNKILTQKKQYNLKINTNNERNDKAKPQSNSFLNKGQQLESMRKTLNNDRSSYNTKDSIINQIYRETRY